MQFLPVEHEAEKVWSYWFGSSGFWSAYSIVIWRKGSVRAGLIA